MKVPSNTVPFYVELRHKIDELALDDFGLAPVEDAQTYPIFLERVKAGACAGLSYLTDQPELRQSPTSILNDAKTIVVVALAEKRLRDESKETTDAIFNAPELRSTCSTEQGLVSGYATCLDYHDVLRKRLKELANFIRSRFPNASLRACVDTAPLLEKDWATRAGIGFVGLNSLTIAPRLGSRFFLGELLVSIPFTALSGCSSSEEYLAKRGRKFEPDRCLTCRRCVDACPTGALLGDRTLDARRCLNYWTIENQAELPQEIAEKLDGRLFGCDLCQRVCPHNQEIETAQARTLPLDAVERLDDETFRKLFKKTPVFRARVTGLQRVARALAKQTTPTNDKK